MTISLSNLRYAKADNSMISMDVAGWQGFPTIPFAYHPEDASPLTLEVKAILIGPNPPAIAAYSAPVPTNAEMKANVDTYRDQRLAAGYADATTAKTYQCRDSDITKWNAIGSSAGLAVVMGTNPAPTFQIIAADNSTVTLSPADAFALLNGRVMPWVSATLLYARTLKNQIDAGTPPADITAGWP